MPRFFEMRSKEDIKVIFTGSKALEILLGVYNEHCLYRFLDATGIQGILEQNRKKSIPARAFYHK